MSSAIRIWNRETQREETELVYGDAAVQFFYGGSRIGGVISDALAGNLPSLLYGAYQSSSLSRHKIQPFIEKFKIRMEEYQDPGFRSFNDFFIRQFKEGARVIASEPKRMPAFAEARYLAFDKITPDRKYPVKGQFLTARALLEDEVTARAFEGGPLMIARLCPTDYHRFHFPDDGSVQGTRRLPGRLHSVNPLALRSRGDILCTNERHVTILKTQNFGRIAYIEVGALCVGKIVQTHATHQGDEFSRGQEKGYFLFGASTVIILGEPGAWKPDADLLEQTARERETLVKLGSAIAAV